MPPHLTHQANETSSVSAADSTKLFVRCWRTSFEGDRKGTALIVHGLGEHSGRYGHVAKVLNDVGLDVWAHDHRGFGKSDGARARIPESNTLIEDTKLIFETIRDREGGVPLLLGHSMGGAIAARAVTGGWIEPRALVLSSPGLRSYINRPMRALAKTLEYVLPNLAVPHGLPLTYISHDPEVLAEAAADPLNHALISPRITMFILEAGEAAIRDAGKLSVPTLVQAAGDDKLVDPTGSKEFAAAAPPGLCTLKIYEGLFHEIYNEREPERSAVLADLKDWLLRVVLR
jgi:alpha-beta hydrolase superfamily lysophospholipase